MSVFFLQVSLKTFKHISQLHNVFKGFSLGVDSSKIYPSESFLSKDSKITAWQSSQHLLSELPCQARNHGGDNEEIAPPPPPLPEKHQLVAAALLAGQS